MIKEGAPSATIANARTELAYVRHAKGPVYQTHLLTYLGIRQVDAVVSAQQTPLERVREIGAALGVQINAQKPTHVQRAVRALERPVLPPGHSPIHASHPRSRSSTLPCRRRGIGARAAA